jgi:hypothetical protein
MTLRFELLTIAGLGIATLLVLSATFATVADAKAPETMIIVNAY